MTRLGLVVKQGLPSRKNRELSERSIHRIVRRGRPTEPALGIVIRLDD